MSFSELPAVKTDTVFGAVSYFVTALTTVTHYLRTDPATRVEALLGEKVEIRLLNAVYWIKSPI